jgi:uncharacterized protein (DUF983 family)
MNRPEGRSPTDAKDCLQPPYAAQSSLKVGLRCRCPRCGRGRLFAGFVALAARCDVCGLDVSFADPADGPAFFVMTGVGFVVTGLWAWWALAAQPPIWLQFAVVMPTTIAGCLGLLRPVKAWLVAEQYVQKAGEVSWDSAGKHGEGGFVTDVRKVAERPGDPPE